MFKDWSYPWLYLLYTTWNPSGNDIRFTFIMYPESDPFFPPLFFLSFLPVVHFYNSHCDPLKTYVISSHSFSKASKSSKVSSFQEKHLTGPIWAAPPGFLPNFSDLIFLCLTAPDPGWLCSGHIGFLAVPAYVKHVSSSGLFTVHISAQILMKPIWFLHGKNQCTPTAHFSYFPLPYFISFHNIYHCLIYYISLVNWELSIIVSYNEIRDFENPTTVPGI